MRSSNRWRTLAVLVGTTLVASGLVAAGAGSAQAVATVTVDPGFFVPAPPAST